MGRGGQRLCEGADLIHTYMYICIHTIYICIHTHIYIYTYMYIYIYTHTHIYIHIYISIYLSIYLGSSCPEAGDGAMGSETGRGDGLVAVVSC